MKVFSDTVAKRMLCYGEMFFRERNMSPFLKQVVRSAVPTCLALALMGFLLSQLAGMWHASANDGRTTPAVAEKLSESLEVRLPLTMAAWGFAFIVLSELFRSLWKPADAVQPVELKAEAKVETAKHLLLQMLDLADAAERERANALDLTQTPMPVRELVGLTESHHR